MMQEFEAAHQYIISKYKGEKPQLGIILGTGLGALVNDVNIICEIAYEDIPHFPVSTVESHKGKLIFGELSGKKVVIMQGRFHYYEGYTMKQVTFPIRVFKMLGIEKLVISNASGGLNEQYQLGDLMIINDHISLMPENPLTGKNLDEFGDHLKSDDFFGVEKHPEAKLAITKVDGSKATGKITIKGITEEINFDLTNIKVTDNMVSASATLKVDRTKHKVMYGWTVENAMLSNEFQLEVSIVATK